MSVKDVKKEAPPLAASNFFVELFLIVIIFFSDLGHPGLEFLHFLHGLIALMRERPEEDLDQDREQDDGYPIIADVLVEKA